MDERETAEYMDEVIAETRRMRARTQEVRREAHLIAERARATCRQMQGVARALSLVRNARTIQEPRH
jgi:hypothetical protein